MNTSELEYELHLKRRESYRRSVGLWLGALIGLAFGVVSQTINLLAMPGLSLYQPPFGAAGNILLFTLLGAVLGGVCGWFFGSAEGVLISSALGAGLLLAAVVASGHRWETLGQRIIASMSLFLPASAALVPTLGVMRWVINQQEEYRHLPVRSVQRIWRPALLVLLAAGIGVLWLMPDQGQRSLRNLDALIQSSQRSTELPEAFAPPAVENYRTNAQSQYVLDWERYSVSRYGIGYFPKAGWEPTAAIARFENGWTLVCIYTNPEFPPSCKSFGE